MTKQGVYMGGDWQASLLLYLACVPGKRSHDDLADVRPQGCLNLLGSIAFALTDYTATFHHQGFELTWAPKHLTKILLTAFGLQLNYVNIR